MLPSAQSKNIEITADLEAALTPCAGDPQRLLQVFRNLLANALKFTSDGGWIKVAASIEDGWLAVTVEDNGQGIAAEFLPHVFERFRQADGSTTRSQGGLGLGLAIVRRLVDLHGGSVSAFSEGLGKGACFEVRLPAAPEQRAAGEALTRRPETSAAGPERTLIRGTRILLVEDDHDGRDMVEQLLRHHGGEVHAVDSAERALQFLQHESVDVMISDIGMPQVDGYELLARARAAGKHIAAIALTAFARPEDRIKALEVGYAMHLSKPVEPPELIDAVATLARHRARSR
jgi:CheY-like chemotaxis protein